MSKQLQVRAGVQNLLNGDTPFFNQRYCLLSTHDPTYSDPKGRSLHTSLGFSS